MLAGLIAGPAVGFELNLPDQAKLKKEDVQPLAELHIPSGPWRDGIVPGSKIDGKLTRQVFHTFNLLRPAEVTANIAAQLEAAGYTIQYSCQDKTCGGFDFRFDRPLIPPPDMFVDLGNYAFVSATLGDDQAVTVLASVTQTKTHIHISYLAPETEITPTVVSQPSRGGDPLNDDLASQLGAKGRFVLDDLQFETGSSQLKDDQYDSLTTLSDYLLTNPHLAVALVGHTDAVGALAGNIALSKKRAGAVRTLFLNTYGIAAGRVAAEGMGYLAPRATNTTVEGREKNRRVEVIVTTTE